MSKTLHAVEVRGKEHTWCVDTYITKEAAQAWREDGIEVNEISNRIPYWALYFVSARTWCFFQDLFNFRNPFR